MRRMIPNHDGRVTREQVFSACPWAATVIEADQCWIAFEFISDYLRWLRQA